jgi:hypothetical protein
MTSSITGRPIAAFAVCLLLVASFGTRAVANVYLDLVVDPPTTAFSGIPAVHGFSGLSNRSGAGTWRLYAIDDVDNSFGISSYAVKLNPGTGGAIPVISNRSPRTDWEDLDEDVFTAGFTDLRSASNSNPITGAQGIGIVNTPRIGGFGISASDFQLKTGGQSFVSTNGQWGNYADFGGGANPSFAHGHNPLFLAEGTYTGGAPTVDLATPATSGGTSIQYWTNAALTASAAATQISMFPQCTCGVSVSNGSIPNVNANIPGFVNFTFTGFADLLEPAPLIWSALSQPAFYPTPGQSGTFAAQPATFDPATQKFHWNTTGAPLGQYRWFVSASAGGFTSQGLLDVYITAVPEPATLSLIGLTTIAGGLILRRRA